MLFIYMNEDYDNSFVQDHGTQFCGNQDYFENLTGEEDKMNVDEGPKYIHTDELDKRKFR